MELQDIKIENAVIGSILNSKTALLTAKDQIEIKDFYHTTTRAVYQAIVEITDKGLFPDVLTVKDVLEQKKIFDKIGHQGLLEIFQSVTTSINIQHYIDRLKDLSQRRQLAEINIQNYAFDNRKPVADLLDDLQDQIKAVDREKTSRIISAEELFNNDISNFQFKSSDFVKTGIGALDKVIYGMLNSETVVLAARPSCGKSALALNIARHQAENSPVLLFSLEMPKLFLAIRLLAAETNIDGNSIQHNRLDNFQLKKLQEASERLKRLQLHIDDRSGLTSRQIVNTSKRFAEYKKPGLIIVDYLQILKNKSNDVRYIGIGEDMKELKNLGREFNIPILILSQLGRGAEGNIPTMKDLRESGDIENDSDKIIFIYFTDEEKIKLDPAGKLLIAKNKNGSTGNADIIFEKRYTKFMDI